MIVSVTGSPPPVTRDDASRAARHELAKPPYHRHDPSAVDKAISWLWKHLSHLFQQTADHAPGHGIGVALVLVIAIVIAAVIARRIGPLRRTTSFREPVFGDHELSAAQYRKNADDYAASSQWALAVRERLRAIARELEERGMLDPRPSRTAAELCRDASAQRPDLSQNLREATSAFDAIWYGGRTAGPADDELLRALDHRLVVPGRLAVLGHR